MGSNDDDKGEDRKSVFSEAEERAVERRIREERAKFPKLTPAMKADLALLLKPAVERVAARRAEERAEELRRAKRSP